MRSDNHHMSVTNSLDLRVDLPIEWEDADPLARRGKNGGRIPGETLFLTRA